MRCQASSAIASTAARTVLIIAHADRVLPAGLLQPLEDLGVPEPRVGAQQLDAGRAGPLDARDQLLAEAQHPLLRVRRPLAQPDVQRLARVRAGGEDRVVAEAAACSRRRRPASAGRRPRRRSCRRRSPAARRRARRPPATRARAPAPSSASSWRTCPNVNARRNVPSVDGAGIQPPSSRRVRPARSTSVSSMLSAPSTIA